MEEVDKFVNDFKTYLEHNNDLNRILSKLLCKALVACHKMKAVQEGWRKTLQRHKDKARR
jgi:hypothetical protein